MVAVVGFQLFMDKKINDKNCIFDDRQTCFTFPKFSEYNKTEAALASEVAIIGKSTTTQIQSTSHSYI